MALLFPVTTAEAATDEESAREPAPALTLRKGWRTSRRKRPTTTSIHLSAFGEQAAADQAALLAMTEVMDRAVGCLERATTAA